MENSLNKNNLFYRTCFINGEVLTEVGLVQYFKIRKKEEPELTKNIELAISYDNNVRCNDVVIKTKKFLSNTTNERKYLIVHTNTHTSFIAKEGNFILTEEPMKRFLDSGFEEQMKKLFLNVISEPIQHDYNNCRIFAVQNCIELERYLKNYNYSLEKICKESPAENIGEISVPLPLIPHIQSVSRIMELTGKNFDELDNYNIRPHCSYREELTEHIYETNSGKLLNCTINDESDRCQQKVEKLLSKTEQFSKITQSFELLSITEKYDSKKK